MAQFSLELCFRVASLAVLLPLASGACVDLDLGMGRGIIPNSNITASSVHNATTSAKNGRLNYRSGSSWCARTNDTNPYLQIDLQTLHIICAVSTQGNSQAGQWVKNYTLQFSTNGTTWTDYKEDEQVKFLRGNDDRNSEVKHVVYGVLTRYLQFLPQTHQGGVCMRTEVFGVEQKLRCSMQAIGVARTDTIPDSSFSALSTFSPGYVAKYGRLNGTRSWAPKNNRNAHDYLQIDLLFEYVICAVATQGSPSTIEWTKTYKIQLSLKPTNFVTYQENNAEKVFPGNKDKDSIAKNSLNEPPSARYIRFVPTQFHGWKILRVEVYGVLLTKVPSQPPASLKFTASSSTSITASWQLPPVFARHGRNIEGFKLFYREKGFAGPFSFLNITSGSTLSRLVAGLHPYTEYEFQVLAYTSSGDGPKSFVEVERTMEGAPSQPPSNFKVTAISSTSVTASWQLPPEGFRNGIIKGFKLFYERKDSSGSGNILTINSESTLDKDVNGLEKYTEYEFRVLAFTSAGDGANSSVVPKRTKEDVPSQPPNGFTLTAATSTSITASWQLPPADSRNGIIIGFKLFYKKKGSFGSPNEQLIGDQATRTKEVTGLNKYTEYEFQILAFTSVGDGKRSAPVFKKTKEDAPSQPPSQIIVTVNSSTSITASWKLPPEDSRHGIIRGFKLYYKKKDSSSATSLTINNGKTSTTRVTKLDEYTEYEFQVLAFTSAGDGPNSSAVFRTTMENAPSAPTSLSSVGVPPSSSHGPRIILFWSKPTEPNGVIRSYNMFYSHDGGAPVMISGIDKNAFSHTVDVLGGVTYQFHVRAVTIKPGPNQTITLTTKEYEPSRGPEEISSAALNSTNINITWLGLPREVAYGKVIRYEVRLIVVENCTQIQSAFHSTINTTITYVIVTGLSFCAKYEVSVRGYTAVGPGPYSRPVMVQTLAEMWSKERPSSPSFSANSKGGGISAKVMLPRFPGNARFFQVIIITYSSNYTGAVKPPGRFTTQDMVTYEEAHKSSVPAPYVAFQFGGNYFYKNKEFVIGDGAQSGGKERSKRSSDDQVYYNKPLQLNTNYRVFLRAFFSETVYVSSNFVTIDTKGKPIIKNLPKRTITAVGELVVLTCEVSGDPEASVTWTKDGLTSIARAQLENNAKILLIKDAVPGDSGVYECKAVNMFGESRTATIVIVAVPPRIIEELSPSSVICEKQTLCFLSCQVTSYIPFNSSWTKDGRTLTGDNMKLLNNSLIVTPQSAQDYGDYMCHATNTFGSTMHKITLVAPMVCQDLDDDTQSILLASVIALSCIVFVLLIFICGLIWQRRRAVPIKMIQSNEEINFDGVKSSPDQLSRDEHSSDPNTYMELKARPSNRESHVPSEYQSLQEKPENPGYYNMVLQKESDGKQNEEVYEEI